MYEIQLEWFRSYLEGKKQASEYCIGNTQSSEASVVYGVQQGSVLGPILVTRYTKPLGAIAHKHRLQLHLFADDAHLYLVFIPVTENELSDCEGQGVCCRDRRMDDDAAE